MPKVQDVSADVSTTGTIPIVHNEEEAAQVPSEDSEQLVPDGKSKLGADLTQTPEKKSSLDDVEPPKEHAPVTLKTNVTEIPSTDEVNIAVQKLVGDIESSFHNNRSSTEQAVGTKELNAILNKLEGKFTESVPGTSSLQESFAMAKAAVDRLNSSIEDMSPNTSHELEPPVRSAIQCESMNLQQSINDLVAYAMDILTGDRVPAESMVIDDKTKAIATIVDKIMMTVQEAPKKRDLVEPKSQEPLSAEACSEGKGQVICKDADESFKDNSSKPLTSKQDAENQQENTSKELDATGATAIEEPPAVVSQKKENTVSPVEGSETGAMDSKKKETFDVNITSEEQSTSLESAIKMQGSKDASKEPSTIALTSTEEAISPDSEPIVPKDLSVDGFKTTTSDSSTEKVPEFALAGESPAPDKENNASDLTKKPENSVSITDDTATEEPSRSDLKAEDSTAVIKSTSDVTSLAQAASTDLSAKKHLLDACQSLNETSENFTEALVDALSSQPSLGMLRSRAESISGVIGELEASLRTLTGDETASPYLRQLNDTVLQLAASVEGSSQTFDDATPLDNRVLEELVAPAIMEVSANIHTLRESIASFTSQLAEAPVDKISDITASHVAMVHDASGNISSAVQEVGLAISNAVEKSRTESFFSADEDTSSMLLDDALQDLSESTTAPIGDRGATWRRLSDLETFGDGNVDTENILNVMSAIGSLKLLQQLAADSEFLTDAVGRVSMAAEQLRSRTPTADETAAPTPLEVRAVCGTLLASIDELTSTVRDLVSDAGCSELDSSLISKIEDYKDTLLSVSAVTDNLVAGRPELAIEGEQIRASIDHLCAQADSILALTAEKSSIAKSLQDAEESKQPVDAVTNEKLHGICSIVSSALEQPQTSEAFGIEAELASEAPYLMDVLLHPENRQRAKQTTEEPVQSELASEVAVPTLKDASALGRPLHEGDGRSNSKMDETPMQALQVFDDTGDKEKTPTPLASEDNLKPKPDDVLVSETIDKVAKQISENPKPETDATETGDQLSVVPTAPNANQHKVLEPDIQETKKHDVMSSDEQDGVDKMPETKDPLAVSVKVVDPINESVDKSETQNAEPAPNVPVKQVATAPSMTSETISSETAEEARDCLATNVKHDLSAIAETTGKDDVTTLPAGDALGAEDVDGSAGKDVSEKLLVEPPINDNRLPMQESALPTEMTSDSVKLETLSVDEQISEEKCAPGTGEQLETLVIDESAEDQKSVVVVPATLGILSIDEHGVTKAVSSSAELKPLVVDEKGATESVTEQEQPGQEAKLQSLSIDEPATNKAEAVPKVPRLKRLSVEGTDTVEDRKQPSNQKVDAIQPSKASEEKHEDKLIRLKVVLDETNAAKESANADQPLTPKDTSEESAKVSEPGVPLPTKPVPETVTSAAETLSDIIQRAVGGEIATIKEAELAAERMRTALTGAAESVQETGEELVSFRSQAAAIGGDLSLVTDALQDTIRSVRGTKMATKIQKDRIAEMVRPAADEVTSRVETLVAAVRSMSEALKTSTTQPDKNTVRSSADAVSTELHLLSAAIDKSNDVRSDAVERMKGLEDKIVVTEKTVEFKDALGELLNAVECALVERGPGSDAVVNLQAASCRHAAAKMVTAVTGVTGDRVLPERAQETIEANIATVAREAVAVTAHMRGAVPFEELLAVHPPLQERVNELRHIEEQTLSAPGALAEAAETTPVSEFNELFLGSVKEATSATNTLAKMLHNVGEEHANATNAYHGKEARKIVSEDIDSLQKTTNKFFASLINNASGSSPSGSFWERESLCVASVAECVHKSVTDLHVLEPAVRDCALPMRSGDVIKHASGVVKKCVKQLAILMDRVPPGKAISGSCDIDQLAEKADQLGSEMADRLKTGAAAKDESIEKVAEELQAVAALCMKKIRKELKIIDDEIEIEEEEKRLESKKKRIQEAEQKTKEEEAKRTEEEEKRKERSQQMKERMEIEEKDKEKKEEEAREEDSKKRKKRKTVEKEEQDEKSVIDEKTKTVKEERPKTEEHTSIEDGQKKKDEDNVNQQDETHVKNKHDVSSDGDMSDKTEDADRAAGKPRKTSGKLDPSLIVERRIIPPEEEMEAKKLNKKVKSQDSSDLEIRPQKTLPAEEEKEDSSKTTNAGLAPSSDGTADPLSAADGEHQAYKQGEETVADSDEKRDSHVTPKLDQPDTCDMSQKGSDENTADQSTRTIKDTDEVRQADIETRSSAGEQDADSAHKEKPKKSEEEQEKIASPEVHQLEENKHATPKKDTESLGDAKQQRINEINIEKIETNDTKKKAKKTKSKEKKTDSTPDNGQVEKKEERAAGDTNLQRRKSAPGADDPDKIPRVLRAEDQLARAVGETNPPEPEVKTGKRKKSMTKTKEDEVSKPAEGKAADKRDSISMEGKQLPFEAKEVLQNETVERKEDSTESQKAGKEPSGFAAAPRDSTSRKEPRKLSQDAANESVNDLQKKQTKEAPSKADQDVGQAPGNDAQKLESVASVDEKETKVKAEDQGTVVGKNKSVDKELPVTPDKKAETMQPEKEREELSDSKSEKTEVKPCEDNKPGSEKKKKKRKDKDLAKTAKEERPPETVGKPEPNRASGTESMSVPGTESSGKTDAPHEEEFPQMTTEERMKSPDGAQRRRRESAEHYVEHRRDPRRRPRWTNRLQDKTTMAGTRVRLSCTCATDDDVPVEVDWYLNGALLRPESDQRLRAWLAADGAASLEISDVGLQDGGEYTCTARNMHGRASCTADLHVRAGAIEPRPGPPTFLTGLRVSYILEDDVLIIECQLAGHPAPRVTWLRDGAAVTSSDRVHQTQADDGVCKLLVQSPQDSDNGKYTCLAENRVGSAEISEHITVPGGAQPRPAGSPERPARSAHTASRPVFLDALRDVEASQGRDLDLKVKVAGSPSPDISWLHNGQPVRPSARLRAWGRFPDYALSLHSLTAADAGTYTCRAANVHGAATCSANVSLGAAGAGQPARIVEKPDDLIRVANGGDLLLTCRIAGEPRPKVAFHKGRQNLLASRRATLEVAGELCHLHMERLHFSDSGTYCVEAQNADGADRCYVLVRVKEPNRAQTPDWDSRTSSRLMASADLRRTQRFTQDVPGPLPGRPYTRDVGQNWVSLAWPRPLYNGGAPILSYKVEAWLKCEDAMWDMVGMSVICSMDIFDLKPARTYIFRVTPRNRYGWGEGSCSLPVLVGRERVAPRFGRLLPATTKCLLGDCLELQCQVSGEPAPEVVWLRDGIPLPAGLCRLRVAHQGDLCRLSVSAVRPSDQATYTCQAVNTAGQASTFTRLTVVERELLLHADRAINSALESAASAADRSPSEPLAPYFLVRPRERRVAVGSSVRLTCQVTGHPLPEVTWAKDGVPLQQNERFAMWHEAHHFHTLEITAARFDELGTYSAVASNEHGDITCSCTLVVDRGHLLYAGPELVRSLPEVTRVSATAGLELQARCTAYPAISVLWHRDGRRVRIARRQTLSLDGNGLATLRIGSASHGDAGNYSCTMSNEMGSVVTATRLVVQDSPDGPVEAPCFVRDPVSSHVLEGDSVTVTCEVVGDPAPEVSWHRQEPAQDPAADTCSWELVEDSTYSVRLPEARLADAGSYVVAASNRHGTAQRTMSLEVTGKENTLRGKQKKLNGSAEPRPSFATELRDVRCCDGDSVTLKCRLRAGCSGAAVQWHKDGAVLSDCGEFRQTRIGDVLRLSIAKVHPEDQGQYTCHVVTDSGRAASRACLIVDVPEDSDLHVTSMLSSQEGPPPPSVGRQHLSTRAAAGRLLSPRLSVPRTRAVSEQPGSYLLSSGGSAARARRRLEAPRFYAAPYDRTAEEGENVTLKCSVSGQPNPAATWDKEGATLRNSDKFRVTEAGDERLLLIRGVQKSDAGLYRVTLHSDAGRTQATARLSVIGRPRPLSPMGVPGHDRPGSGLGHARRPRPRTESGGRAAGGDPLSHPASGVWFCDGEIVPGGQPIRLADRSATCAPPGAETSPVGGEMAAPVFAYPLQSRSVMEGDRVRLDATVTGAEPLKVTWVKNNVPIRDCADFRHVTAAGGHFSLVIDDIYPADEGFYFCEAWNAHGRTVCHCHVTVIEDDGAAERPSAAADPAAGRSVAAPTGAAVRLWVRSTGVATVQWSLNGQPVQRLDPARVKVSQSGGAHALEILRLTEADAGTVEVSVRGPAGSWRSQVALTLAAPPDAGVSRAPTDVTGTQRAAAPALENGVRHSAEGGRGGGASGSSGLPAEGAQEPEDRTPEPSSQTEQPAATPADRTSESTSQTEHTDRAPESSSQTEQPAATLLDRTPEPSSQTEQPDRAPEPSSQTEQPDRAPEPSSQTEQPAATLSDRAPEPSSQTEQESEEEESVSRKSSLVEPHSRKSSLFDSCSRKSSVTDSSSSRKSSVADFGSRKSSVADSCSRKSSVADFGSRRSSLGAERRLIVQGPASLAVLLGQTARLECRLQPPDDMDAPTAVVWSKAGRRLEPSERVTVEATPSGSVLTLRQVTADDSGKYVVRAGQDECWASLAVEGPPEPPSGVPNVCRISQQAITLSWCGPPFDGGSMVTEYQVETADEQRRWRLLVDHCRSTSVVVDADGLAEAPCFRVRAVNKHGCSAPGLEAAAPAFSADRPADGPTDGPGENEDDETDVGAPFPHRHVTLTSGVDFGALYDVQEELGKGRFGMVHKVVERSTGNRFAAKFIKCIKLADRAKVGEEIAIMNQLDHPKLLQLAAAIDHGRQMIMLLEYVSGGELFERVVADDFTLTEHECVLFMQQICSGVRYMHDNNIMHLDMKPENILCITKSSHMIKIIDFGLARQYRESEPTRVMLGTPEFIPPEIINFEPISPRSDMWSLGVICYILLSGLSPFMGDNDAETFANITRAEFDFDDDAFDAVSDAAKEFITSLLRKRQTERMSACRALTHPWLTTGHRGAQTTVLSKEKLKKFIIRRKWQRTARPWRAG
ncbi:titin homolog isoform X2 [Amphibalanus amphitrite]|nr:titin homolog isoform X2 [Amphibalanus amphitrite]